MNERIKQLAEQAHSYACEYARRPDYNPHNPYNEGMYKQRYDSKFAELIVKECADIAKHHVMNISTYADAEFVEKQIEKHFGVEQ